MISREPFSFDADGFEEGNRYALFRDTNGQTLKYHNVRPRLDYDGCGFRIATFDVSYALVTIEPLGTRT